MFNFFNGGVDSFVTWNSCNFLKLFMFNMVVQQGSQKAAKYIIFIL